MNVLNAPKNDEMLLVFLWLHMVHYFGKDCGKIDWLIKGANKKLKCAVLVLAAGLFSSVLFGCSNGDTSLGSSSDNNDINHNMSIFDGDAKALDGGVDNFINGISTDRTQLRQALDVLETQMQASYALTKEFNKENINNDLKEQLLSTMNDTLGSIDELKSDLDNKDYNKLNTDDQNFKENVSKFEDAQYNITFAKK